MVFFIVVGGISCGTEVVDARTASIVEFSFGPLEVAAVLRFLDAGILWGRENGGEGGGGGEIQPQKSNDNVMAEGRLVNSLIPGVRQNEVGLSIELSRYQMILGKLLVKSRSYLRSYEKAPVESLDA